VVPEQILFDKGPASIIFPHQLFLFSTPNEHELLLHCTKPFMTDITNLKQNNGMNYIIQCLCSSCSVHAREKPKQKYITDGSGDNIHHQIKFMMSDVLTKVKERTETRVLSGIQTISRQCKIWGFHGSDYEESCLLGCYAVWLL
jgi:hypothetical protein